MDSRDRRRVGNVRGPDVHERCWADHRFTIYRALERRTARAIALISVAVVVMVVAAVAYLRPFAPAVPGGAAVGATPSPTTVPRLGGDYVPAFFFIDPKRGWSLVVDRVANQRFWIFATSDGAAHWKRQLTGAASRGPAYLRFFDSLRGFAYAGSLYRTLDGGSTWQLMRTPPGGPNLVFASANKGWNLGDRLYATDDGGGTWKPVDSPLPPSVTGDLAFRDDGEGWLGAALETPTVYHTLDGGTSWTPVTIPVGEPGVPEYPTIVRLLPGGAVLAIVASPSGFVGGYVSGNRGASWRGVRALPEPEWVADASFIDASNWWVSRYGFLYKTPNAGQNWTRVDVEPLPTGWNIDPVHALDDSHGWWTMTATTDSRDSALMMTSDGGSTWRAVAMPTPS